ncbi:MAG: hypothetical protein MRY83_00140 [Flavobacteriales bacterium]|nr:hypothetical protein [Flavobacteriales bacterium]
MKWLLFLIAIGGSLNLFTQNNFIEKINEIRLKQEPELGKDLCTEGFWTAEVDAGERVFKRLCKYGDDVQLKVSKEFTESDRVVLVTDFIRDGVKRDEVYLYLVKKDNEWFMDGFNESKDLIPYFLKGSYSGHFQPTDLPSDPDLVIIGKKIAEFDKDGDAIMAYIKSTFESGSDFTFVGQLEESDYGPNEFESAGYDKNVNKGYIHIQQPGKYYKGSVCLYVVRQPSGKYKIIDANYGSPSARSFF